MFCVELGLIELKAAQVIGFLFIRKSDRDIFLHSTKNDPKQFFGLFDENVKKNEYKTVLRKYNKHK